MALRHFVKGGSLRGVSLLMWLGANADLSGADLSQSFAGARSP